MTERLYVKDVYAKSGEMTLEELREGKHGTEARFDRTLFFPTGGGQPHDNGTIAGIPIIDVYEDKESREVWHVLGKDAGSLKPGMVCKAELDWERRFRHMQLHAGEHLISGAFYKLFNAQNKGFHMGEDYVTIDIDLPEISSEMMRRAERFANEIIWQALPINTFFFDTAANAKSLPVRKAIKADEDVSVVVVGDPDDPADCCACCGTHPRSAGEIGIIKITHAEKYKGMTRYYVKCGSTAYDDYSEKQDICGSLGRKYSCDPKDLEKALTASEERSSVMAKRLSALKAFVTENAAAGLEKELKQAEENSAVIKSFDQLEADDLQNIARAVEDSIGSRLLLLCADNTVILACGGDVNCGALVKENAAAFGGKGGGKPQLARAVFANAESARQFANAVAEKIGL